MAYATDSKSVQIEGSTPSVATKVCIKCLVELPVSMFHKHGNKTRNTCPECVHSYGKNHYLSNKQRYMDRAHANNKTYIDRNTAFVRDLKSKTPCVDCHLVFPHYVMDFDHLEGFVKINDIAVLMKTPHSLDLLKKEIEKCEIVCSNCHRARTWKRAH